MLSEIRESRINTKLFHSYVEYELLSKQIGKTMMIMKLWLRLKECQNDNKREKQGGLEE